MVGAPNMSMFYGDGVADMFSVTKMEAWVISLIIAALLKYLYDFFFSKLKLPPGPAWIPFVGNIIWLFKSLSDLEPILRNLHAKYGPIVTLRIGASRTAVFISSNSLAYKALVQNGAIFADRPPALPANRILSRNQRNINSCPCGPTWRLLRRNLTSEILHPSRVRSYNPARKWVLGILTSRLQAASESGEAVTVVDHFRYAMSCLLVLMCFGDKLEEKQINEICTTNRRLLLDFSGFDILNMWPKLGKVLFQRKWEELYQLRKIQEDSLLPYIRARQQLKQQIKSGSSTSSNKYVLCYVDTLLDVQLPEEENRNLNGGEMVSLCSEFLTGGTDTTSTALQWIMANLVKQPHIQAKLFQEINGVIGERKKEEVEEEDVEKMTYLKAVILEGLRRHPLFHIVWAHSATEDTNFEGYLIPKKASVNFVVPEINWNPEIWEDPMEFRPERFLMNRNGDEDDHEEVYCDYDITGSKEIKMLSFGAGRRMCAGYGLAMLHLEYFLANLVWNFEWKTVEGDEVDLSEKQEFTVVMKNPLKVLLRKR